MEYYSKLERIARDYIIKPIKIAALATSLYLTNKAYSRDIYIPQDYPRIQAGIDAAENSDNVIVFPGTYNELIDFKGKVITLKSSDGADKTIIDGSGLDDSVVKCVSGEGRDTILEGFTITRGRGSSLNLIEQQTSKAGGGMFNGRSAPSVRNCSFLENSPVGDEGRGGGMYNSISRPNIFNCSFIGNSARWGGGIHNYLSNPIIEECTFINNTAEINGGGIANNGSDNIIYGCIFIFNTNTDGIGGGGIASSSGDIHITNSTIVYNYGGALLVSNGTLTTITNCILWNNDQNIRTIDNTPFPITIYSNIQGTIFSGTGNISADPLFVDPAHDDFRLQPNSPCIDAGDPLSPLDPDGTRADMGALFYDQGPPLPPPQFIRGDANRDEEFDISDPIYTLLYEFAIIPQAKCLDALDADDNGRINITDPIYMLNSIFLAGPNPPAPFPEAGTDPTSDLDNLTCD